MTDRRLPNWQEFYRDRAAGELPWYYPELDPDLESALARDVITGGLALDLGCGPGTQAVALAERGFHVTATDVSADAIEQARALSQARGVKIEFAVDDVMQSRLEHAFDVVFDRGCYHVFAPAERTGYVATLAKLVRPGGTLFLKCFSDEQPGAVGPYQSHPDEVRAVFGEVFEVVSIVRTIYQGTLAHPPKALFCTLHRR